MSPAADSDRGVTESDWSGDESEQEDDEFKQGGDGGPTETESVPVIEGHAVWFNEYRY